MKKETKLGTSYRVAFSADGCLLAAIGRDVVVWDLAQQKKLFRAHPFSHSYYADFSPSGLHLAVKNTSGRIVVLSALTGEIISDFKNEIDGEGSNILFSARGDFLIDGTWNGQLSVRHADTGTSDWTMEFLGEMITEVHRYNHGKSWAVMHTTKATTDDQPPAPNYFSLWDWPFNTGDHRRVTFRCPLFRSSALSADGQFLAIVHSSQPASLSVFNFQTQDCINTVEVISGGTGAAITWSPDRQMIASVQAGAVVIYQFPELKPVCEISIDYPCDVAFSPDGSLLAVGSWDTGWLLPVKALQLTPKVLLKSTPSKPRPEKKVSGTCKLPTPAKLLELRKADFSALQTLGALLRAELGLSGTETVAVVLQRLTQHVETLRPKFIDLQVKQQLPDVLAQLSAAYGDLLVRECGWSYVDVSAGPGSRHYGLASPDRAHALMLAPFMRKQLENPAEVTLTLQFNMIKAGQLPPGGTAEAPVVLS